MSSLAMQSTPSHPGKVPAREVGSRIRAILDETGTRESKAAQGLGLGEAYFSRMKNRRSGSYRRESLLPLERLSRVVDFAKGTLSGKGVKDWLREPHPALNNVAPILCLRSEEEAEKVISLLAAIRHGFPA